jgi:GNAT superfamily N-acetyltransferase
MNHPTPSYSILPAEPQDVPALTALIALSTRGLASASYTGPQIEAALGTALGVDTELIRDRSYFKVVAADQIVACGGWSRRKTLFGSDALAGRESALLDPQVDAARIRAFFVHPAWARRGIGRALLAWCEDQARASGFKTLALMSTLPGHPLYKAQGYEGDERIFHPLTGGEVLALIPMTKTLA